MNELQRLLALAAKLAASGKATPEEIDQWIAAKSGGKVRSVAEAQQVVARQEKGKSLFGLLRPFEQGALFDFADESAGGINKITPGMPNYTTARDAFREGEAETREAHPTLSKIAYGVGALLTGVGAARAGAKLAARGLLGRAAQGAVTGAAASGAVAAGEAPELSDVPGAVAGAVPTGAAAGGVLGLIAPALVRAGLNLPSFLRGLVDRDYAVKVRYQRIALKAFQDAGMQPTEAAAALASLEKSVPGQPILADVSPRLGRELRTSVNTNPAMEAPVRELLTGRQAGQASRLAEGLETDMGVTGSGAREARLQAQASLPNLGKQIYAPLEKQTIDFGPETRSLLDQFQSHPEVASLVTKQVPQEGGRITFGHLQSLRQDMMDLAGEARTSGRGNAMVFWKQQASDLTDNMEKLFPGFKDANAIYRVAATLGTEDVKRNAFQLGAKALSQSSADVETVMRALNAKGGQEAADAYRMGFVEAITTQLQRLTRSRDASNAIANMGKNAEAKLKVLFPTDAGSKNPAHAIESFLARAKTERAFLATSRAALGNSTTAQQLTDAGANVASGAVSGGVYGGVKGAVVGAGRAAGRALEGDVMQRGRGVVGSLLMSHNSPKLLSLLDELQRISARSAGRQSFAQAVGAYGAPAAAGGLLGQR